MVTDPDLAYRPEVVRVIDTDQFTKEDYEGMGLVELAPHAAAAAEDYLRERPFQSTFKASWLDIPVGNRKVGRALALLVEEGVLTRQRPSKFRCARYKFADRPHPAERHDTNDQ